MKNAGSVSLAANKIISNVLAFIRLFFALCEFSFDESLRSCQRRGIFSRRDVILSLYFVGVLRHCESLSSKKKKNYNTLYNLSKSTRLDNHWQ